MFESLPPYEVSVPDRTATDARASCLAYMPLYFLHIRDGQELIEDPDGSELPDLDAARAEALAAARAILADRVRLGELINGRCIEITDAAGTVLASVAMRDALRLA